MRVDHFNAIKRRLAYLATDIDLSGGLNLLDGHLHAETFYRHFFNLLFSWNLENLNLDLHNAPGVDLIDSANKLVVQVSSTAKKTKIESALKKDLSQYSDYTFKFISISKDSSGLRQLTYKNPHGLAFNPKNDIYDISGILAFVKELPAVELEGVYEFLKSEIQIDADPISIGSNIAAIIQILASEDWNDVSEFETTPFEILEKADFNGLDEAVDLLRSHAFQERRIERIYSTFDEQGQNKSLSVLNRIRSEFLLTADLQNPDQRFFSTVQRVLRKVEASSNYSPLAEEELEMSVQILVVDAFMRCKIFKNPNLS